MSSIPFDFEKFYSFLIPHLRIAEFHMMPGICCLCLPCSGMRNVYTFLIQLSILYLYFFIYSQEMPISNWISNSILPEHLRSGLEKLILFLFRNRETKAEEGQVAKPCVMHWIQKIPQKSRLLCDAIGIALYNSADLK